jgi:hypothetical protein
MDYDREKKRKKHVAHYVGSAASNNPQQQQTVFDMNLNGHGIQQKVLAGRKPMRVIQTELAQKLDQLKNNQATWDAFQARIGTLLMTEGTSNA